MHFNSEHVKSKFVFISTIYINIILKIFLNFLCFETGIYRFFKNLITKCRV